MFQKKHFEKRELTKEETREKALRLLEFRSHSEKELIDKLKISGANECDIEGTITFLKEYNMINDELYATKYAHDLIILKKLGKQRVISELYKKGIDSDIISIVTEDIDDDTQVLYRDVEKKLGGDLSKKSCDRAIRYFSYRGYKISSIIECIEEIKANEL